MFVRPVQPSSLSFCTVLGREPPSHRSSRAAKQREAGPERWRDGVRLIVGASGPRVQERAPDVCRRRHGPCKPPETYMDPSCHPCANATAAAMRASLVADLPGLQHPVESLPRAVAGCRGVVPPAAMMRTVGVALAAVFTRPASSRPAGSQPGDPDRAVILRAAVARGPWPVPGCCPWLSLARRSPDCPSCESCESTRLASRRRRPSLGPLSSCDPPSCRLASEPFPPASFGEVPVPLLLPLLLEPPLLLPLPLPLLPPLLVISPPLLPLLPLPPLLVTELAPQEPPSHDSPPSELTPFPWDAELPWPPEQAVKAMETSSTRTPVAGRAGFMRRQVAPSVPVDARGSTVVIQQR